MSLKKFSRSMPQIPHDLLLSSCSVTSDSATAWTAARQVSLSFTISQSLLKLMSTELMMPSNHLVLCCPLLLPSIFPSIKVFSSELAFPLLNLVSVITSQSQSKPKTASEVTRISVTSKSITSVSLSDSSIVRHFT